MSPYGVEDRAVEDGVAGLDQFQADGLREMAFSHTRRPAPEDVSFLPHETAGRQVEDLLLLDRAVEFPVEIFQGLLLAERGRLGASSDEPLVPDGQLILQGQLQEFGVVEAIGRRLLKTHAQGLGHPAETESLQ
jgi:hypothetical protein